MSLTKITTGNLITKQFRFKLNAHFQVFYSMIIVQVIAIAISVFSFSGGGSTFSGYLESSVKISGNETVLLLSSIWALTMGVAITRKSYRDVDFSFVSTRFTSVISSILFLLFMSLVAGIGVFLSDFLVKTVVILLNEGSTVVVGELFNTEIILISLIVPICYLSLTSIIGYFLGFSFRINAPVAIVIVSLIGGLLIFEMAAGVSEYGPFNPLMMIIDENVLSVFLLKISGMLIALLGLLMFMSRRWEVER